MSLFEVNTATCNKDGICAAVCPAGIIEIGESGHPVPTAEAEELCIQCGHCVAICPTASFSHSAMAVEACQPITKDQQLSLEQCEQFLQARRSIRTYKKQAVSQDELQKIIELARYAPSGHNSQSVQWLVLGNREELHHLAGITVDWMRWMLDNMTEMALAQHMDRTVRRWEEGKDVILRDAPTLIIAHAPQDDPIAPSSSTIALSYLELAATAMGLGCCWAGYFYVASLNFPPMMKALPLPENHKCLGSMMVGYPKFRYHRLPLRKSPEITWRL
jgi:nitroreductase/NAD-dependent dihydropyrimidine dehydrogenase PreA subunit